MRHRASTGDGDGFVTCGQGHNHWGVHGAAGLLLRHIDPQGQDRYLLAKRSLHVQAPGTWGIPGGARDSHETPDVAAVREASEELGPIPAGNVRHLYTDNHGGWQYHTIGADVHHMFEPDTTGWETDDAGWFKPGEIEDLPLHPGFRSTWAKIKPTTTPDPYGAAWPGIQSYSVKQGYLLGQKKTPKDRITQSETELHVGLDIPENARKQIHKWCEEQPWPKGTELESPEEYHVTLMYTPDGHHEHKDADWLEHLDRAHVRVTGIDSFDAQDKGYAHVLRLDAPEVKAHAQKLQDRAEEHGLEITHFPGGYKPHLTVAYGPKKQDQDVEVLPLEFDVGPSSVSPPREDETPAKTSAGVSVIRRLQGEKKEVVGLAHKPPDESVDGTQDSMEPWGLSSPGAKVLDHLSLSSVAHNLHYRFQKGGLDAAGAKEYAERLLQMIGYPLEEMNTLAALQAWQTLYPDDQIEPAQGQLDQAPPTTPTESYGYGTVSSINNLEALVEQSIDYGELYVNDDEKKVQIVLGDADPQDLFDDVRGTAEETYPGYEIDVGSEDREWNPWKDRSPLNGLAKGWKKLTAENFAPMHRGLSYSKGHPPEEEEERKSTEPTPQDPWSDWGGLSDEEKRHRDVQISNDPKGMN